MKTLDIHIPRPPAHTEITIGAGALQKLFCRGKRAVIADETVLRLHPDKLPEGELIPLSAGEKVKCRQEKERLEELLIDAGFGKECTLIAVGGGSLMDLVGFVAATYCRGVNLILCPTTLLGMVDAALGGKNGINCSAGKNFLGTVYQPSQVFCDTDFLKTLPPRELGQGIVEMLKHGALASPSHFEKVQNGPLTDELLLESCAIKKSFIERDEVDHGARQMLNFGHTVGHALEKLSGYNVSHGAAVAFGCIAEALLSHRLGRLSESDFFHIATAFFPYAPEAVPKFSSDDFLEAMKRDKKALGGKVRLVLLQAIGKGECVAVEDQAILEVLDDLRRNYRLFQGRGTKADRPRASLR
ncbi:MAG: 3-dehydroquinate synthase [Chlamydiia bacterium]|nr:3-dehydroquinate synthase [Chlamydiia bacterium]